MRLETAQVLELLGLTKETLRHWKKVLAPLNGRDGRSDGYPRGSSGRVPFH